MSKMMMNGFRVVSLVVLGFWCLSASAAMAQGTTTHTAVTAVAYDSHSPALPRFLALEARPIPETIDLLFLGDSITEGWEGAGKEAWDKHFGQYQAVNQGIGGDRTQSVLWRLENSHLKLMKPRVAVLMIGTNNTGDNTAREIADGIVAIVRKLREQSPQTRILLMAIFPRGEKPSPERERLAEASRLAAAETVDGEHVYYQDIGPLLLEHDGTLTKKTTVDFLHLTPAGYEIWATAIQSQIEHLLKP